MSIITERRSPDPAPPGRSARWLWFVGLYVAGVTVTFAVAAVLKAVLL
jgi:hypothetical protein